jgi:predicted 2-oxoglutarate/Fe(II)-dependent dioxygenase YbiX
MDKKIQIIRDFLTKEECFDLIITYRKKVQRARVINNEFSAERRSKVFIWSNDSELESRFNSSNMTFQFSEYSKLNYYHWHNDFGTAQSNLKRTETCIILLNKEYQGGIFEIKDHDLIELNVGDCLRFDSKLDHRVKPVLKGKRYSLTGWIYG